MLDLFLQSVGYLLAGIAFIQWLYYLRSRQNERISEVYRDFKSDLQILKRDLDTAKAQILQLTEEIVRIRNEKDTKTS